jgi:hypothetical protein
MNDPTNQPAIRISAARKELLAKYADAAGCLYGALSVSEFVDVFNNYESEKTNEQEAILALQRYAKTHANEVEYSVYKEYITGPMLQPGYFEEDIEYLETMRMEQEGKPRYLPNRKELLRYAKASHREPEKPYADLKAYILKNGFSDKEGIDGVDGDLIDLHEMIQDRVEITEIIRSFTEKGYEFNGIDQLNAFLQVVLAAYSNTRMYENNGYTPDELTKIQKASLPKGKDLIIHIPKKVGRNDPCPCGSGKKYKKCCYLTELSGAAQLTYDECVLFYETWYKLLDYVNRKLNVVKYEFTLKYGDPHDEAKLHKIRERLWKKPDMISRFIEDTKHLTYEEIRLLNSWEKHHIKGQFVLMKYTPWHAVLMRIEKGKDTRLYAVMGMTSSIAEAVHSRLPVMLETVLLPFENKIVYDSLLSTYPIGYGDGMINMFEEEFTKSEEKHGIITNLQSWLAE